MIMVMTQHVLPRKDDPPKSVSPDAHPHDEGCMFYGLLENAMLKNTEQAGTGTADDDNDNTACGVVNNHGIAGREGYILTGPSFMFFDGMSSTRVNNDSAQETLQSNIAAAVSGRLKNLSTEHNDFTQTGIPGTQMLQELLSEFQDTAPADIKLSSSPGETVLIQEIISPFPETPLSDTAHLHYRTDKPLPMTAAAADTGEDAVLSVQAGHEAGTPNTGIYPEGHPADETHSLTGAKPVHKQDAGWKPDEDPGNQTNRGSPNEFISAVSTNEPAEGRSGQSESRLPASQDGQSFLRDYIMISSKQLQEDPASAGSAAGPDDSREMIIRLAEKISMLTDGKRSEMEILIKPEELGRIILKVALENGALSVKITTQSQLVKNLLESNQRNLESLLAQEGYDLARLDVNVGEMYHQSQWDDSRNTAWPGSSAKPELKANHTERVISLNEASIVYAGQVKNQIDCFA